MYAAAATCVATHGYGYKIVKISILCFYGPVNILCFYDPDWRDYLIYSKVLILLEYYYYYDYNKKKL